MATNDYDDADRERWVPEPAKRPGRSAFERDRARVLHSAALRRLAAKTQVVVPGESDFPRTRLTHSLECAQVGRELGQALGADPDLVETACLAHDLGHPPFGHTGEAALAVAAEPCGGFEGNAQSLRVLTRLEAKTIGPHGRSVGLNLTRASLDAATKYPWRRPQGDAGAPKFGVYEDDRPVFDWLRAGAPERRSCLEAQVMDWADDVAYSVHDVEDAVHSGVLRLEELARPDVRGDIVAAAVARIAGARPDDVEAALDRLLALDWWPACYDGSHAALAALKDLTSQLIGRFAQAAERATRLEHGSGPLRRFSANLVVPRDVRLEVELLKTVAARWMMEGAEPEERYGRQRAVVTELVEALCAAPDRLEPWLRAAYAEAAEDTARLRVVVDQVASLTDTSAQVWHERITGGIG
jgi:dGTPase